MPRKASGRIRISFFVEPRHEKLAAILAKHLGCTKSDIYRNAIDAYGRMFVKNAPTAKPAESTKPPQQGDTEDVG